MAQKTETLNDTARKISGLKKLVKDILENNDVIKIGGNMPLNKEYIMDVFDID